MQGSWEGCGGEGVQGGEEGSGGEGVHWERESTVWSLEGLGEAVESVCVCVCVCEHVQVV